MEDTWIVGARNTSILLCNDQVLFALSIAPPTQTAVGTSEFARQLLDVTTIYVERERKEAKVSNTGGETVPYRRGYKGRLLAEFRALMSGHLPDCPIRYAF